MSEKSLLISISASIFLSTVAAFLCCRIIPGAIDFIIINKNMYNFAHGKLS